MDDIMKNLHQEIEKLKKELRKYKKLSCHDTLTNLYNRRQLEIDLNRYSNLQKRNKVHFRVLMLDINRFKEINDTKGHKIGDKILIKTANILRRSVRNIDKIYRLQGDEFIIILSHCYKSKIKGRIKDSLAKENIKVSIGESKLQKDILEIVDKKMYEEKRRII